MNTNAIAAVGSMQVAAEGMEGKFEEYLEAKQRDLTQTQIDELKEAFYYGAQALLDAANPLSKIASLQDEISAYLDPEEEGTEE